MATIASGGAEPQTATTTTQTDNDAIDDLDWRIILYVQGHRREYGTGPWWSEVRTHIGLPFVSYRAATFKMWRASQDTSQKKNQWTWKQSVLRSDPLAQRLFKLRRLGFLTFTKAERSLNVAVEPPDDARQARSSPECATAARS